ncbi:MAG: rhodanese-like domain-containing protein [Pseudomonadales bacterium]|nr:rhodanese-like domain-containing protein [Pseudomonadales bacterium]
MDRLFEFIVNHYVLVSIFIILLIAFVINEGKQGGAAVGTSNLVAMVNRDNAVVLDIREAKEYKAGHIVDAINIPYLKIDDRMAELEKYKDQPIIIVCRMGTHAGAVGRKLRAQGFENVHRLAGGMGEWSAANLPVVKK